jgi:transcriptional regulator with XRE-family HTH domain
MGQKNMRKKTLLFETPPYAVENRLIKLGRDLRTARLRRKLTLAGVAEKIGTGVRAITDAEKGKASTRIGIYMALLWVYDLLDQAESLADPSHDAEGLRLSLSREKQRVRPDLSTGKLDNDF